MRDSNPSPTTKPRRIARPSSVRTGMFCRLGSVDDSRPVAATVWLKVVWVRPLGEIVLISPSTVDRSRACSRWRSMITGSSWSVCPASQASASASVVYPVLVFCLGQAEITEEHFLQLLERAEVELVAHRGVRLLHRLLDGARELLLHAVQPAAVGGESRGARPGPARGSGA